MAIGVNILNNSGRLSSFFEELKQYADNTIIRVQKKIPVDNAEIQIFDYRDQKSYAGIEKDTGMGGFSYSSALLHIAVDSDFPTLKDSIGKNLFPLIAHELHHCLRWKNPGYGTTLLEAFITEGLAGQFEEDITGVLYPHIYKALSKDEVQAYLNRARKEFNDDKYNHKDWFFGSDEREIKQFTGYSLGHYLVGEYLKKHPGENAATLYSTPASKFLI